MMRFPEKKIFIFSNIQWMKLETLDHQVGVCWLSIKTSQQLHTNHICGGQKLPAMKITKGVGRAGSKSNNK